MRRSRMSRGHSRRVFSRTAGASRVHPRNNVGTGSAPMRGGIRL